eukprot:5841253-Amphidinium_carterae.2
MSRCKVAHHDDPFSQQFPKGWLSHCRRKQWPNKRFRQWGLQCVVMLFWSFAAVCPCVCARDQVQAVVGGQSFYTDEHAFEHLTRSARSTLPA